MNDFIEITEVFVNNINQSLIERGQLVDSLEILLDKAMDFQTESSNESVNYRRVVSLLEVLIVSLKNNHVVVEDLVMVYEMQRLKPFKVKFLGEVNSSEDKI